jgi:hypothetical protein
MSIKHQLQESVKLERVVVYQNFIGIRTATAFLKVCSKGIFKTRFEALERFLLELDRMSGLNYYLTNNDDCPKNIPLWEMQNGRRSQPACDHVD